MNHLMIDIETLDTKPTAVILSVGAVLFDPDTGQNIDTLFLPLAIQQQLDAGRTVSEDTLRWWTRQKAAILRRQIPDPEATYTAELAFDRLGDLSRHAEGVWGNGATFDNVILADCARTFGISKLWPHRKDRCFRTFTAIYDPKKLLRPNSASHDALEDAKLQVEWMKSILREEGLAL